MREVGRDISSGHSCGRATLESDDDDDIERLDGVEGSSSDDDDQTESSSSDEGVSHFFRKRTWRESWRWGILQTRTSSRASPYSEMFNTAYAQQELDIFRNEVLFKTNISEGAKLLLALNVVALGLPYLLLGLMIAVHMHRDGCPERCQAMDECSWWLLLLKTSGGDRGLTRFFVDLGYLLATSPVLVYNVYRPSRTCYVLVFIAVYLYIWLMHMYPAGSPCTEQLEGYQCAAFPVPEQPVCRQSGFFLMNKDMGLILVTPAAIPEYGFMKVILWSFTALFYAVGLWAITDVVCDNRERYHAYFDLLIGIVFLSCVNAAAVMQKWIRERQDHQSFVMALQQKHTSESMFQILNFMVPPFVVRHIWTNPDTPLALPVERASVLFIKIVDFEQITKRLPPSDLLNFLNRVFSRLDSLCSKHGVTKIETVAEEFVCATGIQCDMAVDRDEEEELGHTEHVGRLINMVGDIMDLPVQSYDNVVLQMGMHTGPLIAGVVGHKLPRFRIFGDTVNTAARMMQKGQPGKLQFGEETKMYLPDQSQAILRGPVEMKGKGVLMTYMLEHRRSSNRIPPTLRPTPLHSVARTGALHVAFDVMQRKSTSSYLISGNGDDSFDAEGTMFENALLEVEEQYSPRGFCPRGFCRDCWWPGGSEGEKFRVWFYNKHLYRKFLRRLDKQAICILILSVLELMYLLCTLAPLPQGGLGDSTRIADDWKLLGGRCAPQDPTTISTSTTMTTTSQDFDQPIPPSSLIYHRALQYSILRCACLAIILCIRLLACLTDIMESPARYFEWTITVCSAIAACLLFFSYEAMPANFVSDGPTPIDRVIPPDYPVAGLSRNMPRLLAFPMYFIAITAHPIRFVQSFTYLAAAIVIVVLETDEVSNILHTRAHEADDFYLLPSYTDKYYFFCFNLLRVMFAFQAERIMRQQYSASTTVSHVLNRVESILDTLMPPLVVQQIRDAPDAELPSHSYENATIAQSDLCGFTALASSRDPSEVVSFISELFGAFDDLTERWGIYKVETVGDAYIAGQAERPLTTVNSPTRVLAFAWGMVLEVQRWSKMRGWDVSCRVGVITGECTGGVVGVRMQRYHLFGQITTALEVLESTAPRGQVQVSNSCVQAVQAHMGTRNLQETFSFSLRHEESLVTSKGDKHEYSEVGGPTYLLVPADSSSKFLPERSLRL